MTLTGEWIKKHLHMNMLRLEMSSSDFINWNSIRQERGLSYPKSWKVDFSLKSTILIKGERNMKKIYKTIVFTRDDSNFRNIM